jgi:hypothetical protein
VQPDESETEICTALNFIIGSIEYYYQRGKGDEETWNALKEAFAEIPQIRFYRPRPCTTR